VTKRLLGNRHRALAAIRPSLSAICQCFLQASPWRGVPQPTAPRWLSASDRSPPGKWRRMIGESEQLVRGGFGGSSPLLQATPISCCLRRLPLVAQRPCTSGLWALRRERIKALHLKPHQGLPRLRLLRCCPQDLRFTLAAIICQGGEIELQARGGRAARRFSSAYRAQAQVQQQPIRQVLGSTRLSVPGFFFWATKPLTSPQRRAGP